MSINATAVAAARVHQDWETKSFDLDGDYQEDGTVNPHFLPTNQEKKLALKMGFKECHLTNEALSNSAINIRRKIKCLLKAIIILNVLSAPGGALDTVTHILSYCSWEDVARVCIACSSVYVFDCIKGNSKALQKICWTNTNFASSKTIFPTKKIHQHSSSLKQYCPLNVPRLANLKTADEFYNEYYNFFLSENTFIIDSILMEMPESVLSYYDDFTRFFRTGNNFDAIDVKFNSVFDLVAVKSDLMRLTVYR